MAIEGNGPANITHNRFFMPVTLPFDFLTPKRFKDCQPLYLFCVGNHYHIMPNGKKKLTDC